MPNFTLTLLTSAARLSKAIFVRKTRKTAICQEKFLFSLLKTHQETEFGKDYSFKDIQTIEQFKQKIPILTYSGYEKYVERIAKGEQNVLTSDPVVYFNQSSGSTGKQKLIPVTKRVRKVRSRVTQQSLGFMTDAAIKKGLPIGKMLLTTSIQIRDRTSGGIAYGTSSVGDLRNMDFLYRQVFVHPYEALKPADSLARNYVCLLFALRNPQMRVIGANFPILALQLADYLKRYAADLIKDIETGKIAAWLNLEPEIRQVLEKQLSAAPQRAAELSSILESEGILTPKMAWQNLSWIITARGGTSNFYFEKFHKYFGDTPVFGGIYAASEATFGIYEDFNSDGTILAIDSGFFEFIPSDEWEKEQPKTVLAHEVEVGKYYRIVVTNYSGLYRYDIGDVVEVVDFYEQAPIIVFRHRMGGLLSATSEKTNEFHATQVMQQLQKEFDLPLENYCITLSDDEIPPCYLLNIELLPGHPLHNSEKFIAEFDKKMQQANVSYEDKRVHNILPPPRLRILASGSFATVRQRLLQKGIPDSHLKIPHINEDRQFLAGLNIDKEVKLPQLKEAGV
ncbi:MAG: GH3 auxin-responsive promoter family protein [Rivularia sp. (in: Bacteria)]|nr:GH3 auxin-responsive promoter family protein [Rivularia sp. MS3]